MVERFRDWCPEVRKLCSLAGEFLKWKLADFDQLDHWVSESGKVCLLGDACHRKSALVQHTCNRLGTRVSNMHSNHHELQQ